MPALLGPDLRPALRPDLRPDLAPGRPAIMGVVNVTPDSFSDGGHYLAAAAAIAHGRALRAAGADLLDVGGEATNPSAAPTSAAEQLRRILPVVDALVADGAVVSVDTTSAEVARAAAAHGAQIINDVSGGLFDPAMAGALADLDVVYVVGHLRGASLGEVFAAERPATWQEVAAELAARLAALPPAVAARAWIDPGLGFGKGADPAVNLALLDHAGDLGRALDRPVVIGASRKRFLRVTLAAAGQVAPTTADLDAATVGASLRAARSGARVLRVHNVALLAPALTVYTKE